MSVIAPADWIEEIEAEINTSLEVFRVWLRPFEGQRAVAPEIEAEVTGGKAIGMWKINQRCDIDRVRVRTRDTMRTLALQRVCCLTKGDQIAITVPLRSLG